MYTWAGPFQISKYATDSLIGYAKNAEAKWTSTEKWKKQ